MELIISHVNCDFDGLASMMAASLLFPTAELCVVGSAETQVKKFISDNQNKFNFIKEKNVVLEDIEQLIIVDNSIIDRMGKIGNWLKTSPKIPIICYDHHPRTKDSIKSDYFHYEQTGACITILLDILHKKAIQLDSFLATVFAFGLYEDTGNFLHSNVTPKDLSAASYLVSLGADLKLISKYLNKDFTSAQISLMNKMLESIETFNLKGIELSFITLELSRYQRDLSYLVQFVKRSQNLKLIFCIATTPKKISIIARNDYDFISVDSILRDYGGGGHKAASSAMINRKEIPDLKNEIIEQLKLQIEDNGIAQDIMTSSVVLHSPLTSIKQAQMILFSKRHDTLLVGENGHLKGLVTKKDISKAIHHNLGNLPVESCMTTDMITISPELSLFEVQRIMIEHDIGRLPVVSYGFIVGIITRADVVKSHFNISRGLTKYTDTFDNVFSIMEKNLSEKQIKLLRKIGYIASQLEMEAYIVGGLVRDLLSGYTNEDTDVVVEGDGIKLAEKLTEKFGGKYKGFEKFGTAVVTLNKGEKIDIASARTEYYEGPGSLPVIEKSSLRLDLHRRDFTINSLAIELNSSKIGTLIDFFGGRRDLKLGLIRVLHNLSFVEDPTRMLRAIRFEQRFNFHIEQNTLHLLERSVQMKSIKTVSKERIRDEFIYACSEKNPDDFFFRLDELGIMSQIYQNLSFSSEKRNLFRKIFENVIWYKKTFPQEKITAWISYHLALISDLSFRSQNNFVDKFKYSKELKLNCERNYKIHDSLELIDAFDKKSEFVRFFSGVSDEVMILIISMIDNEITKEKIRKSMTEWRYVKTELSGKELLNIGLNEGKVIGKLLRNILYKKIDGEITSKDQEMEIVNRFIDS